MQSGKTMRLLTAMSAVVTLAACFSTAEGPVDVRADCAG